MYSVGLAGHRLARRGWRRPVAILFRQLIRLYSVFRLEWNPVAAGNVQGVAVIDLLVDSQTVYVHSS